MTYFETELYKKLGKLLRNARESAGMTLSDTAEKLGVTTMTIQRYEIGKRKISLENVRDLCCLYGVDPDSLMDNAMSGGTSSISADCYDDPDAARIAQEVYERPDLRVLFNAAQDVSPEDLKVVIDLVDRLKK